MMKDWYEDEMKQVELINRTWWCSHDQFDDGGLGRVDGIVGAEDVNVSVSDDDTGLSGVLDGEACLTPLTRYTTNGSTQMLTL
jgi:hypothetical protein